MTDTEIIIHRYIDQELSLEERVAFVARLAGDAAFRGQVLTFDRVVLEAARLRRPQVPAAFVEEVLNRAMPSRPAWRWLSEAALAPRTLRWNLAGAVGVLALVVAALAGTRVAWTPAPDAPSTSAQSTVEARRVLVRLVVVQPGAKTVEVAGDFNGWNAAETPLEPLSGGAWTVTIPLDPGRYEYMFVVNGQQWVADPFAAERIDDGFGSQNAVLDVRAPMGAV